MKPVFHPQAVNDPFGDPVVYVDFLFERRALLFDLGDIGVLPPRRILRLSDIFVSHTHMDHFMGFDRLLRICLGRDRHLTLYGPPGFLDRVEHKLGAYTWNLVGNYATDFTIHAVEYHAEGTSHCARFRCRAGFAREECAPRDIRDGVLLDEETFRVRAVILDHRVPCLAFALEEKQHINVWKNRLVELGLPTGPWLKELKTAVLRSEPDENPFTVHWRDRGGPRERVFTLGLLKREVLRIVPGQKITYVIDAVYHGRNARRITELAAGADVLYIETVFLDADADRARNTCHLTAAQAGRLARAAGAVRMVPMHFSARYAGREEALRHEAQRIFRSGD